MHISGNIESYATKTMAEDHDTTIDFRSICNSKLHYILHFFYFVKEEIPVIEESTRTTRFIAKFPKLHFLIYELQSLTFLVNRNPAIPLQESKCATHNKK